MRPRHGTTSEQIDLLLVNKDESAARSKATMTLLLDGEKPFKLPNGWPTTPRAVRTSLLTIVTNAVVDVLLFTLSVAFLAFALTVNRFDQAPTEEHPRATEMLLEAIKYVWQSYIVKTTSTYFLTLHTGTYHFSDPLCICGRPCRTCSPMLASCKGRTPRYFRYACHKHITHEHYDVSVPTAHY
jgi:hypothetical protein